MDQALEAAALQSPSVGPTPWHLFMPLAASVLFVCGLIFVKRISAAGIGPWTVTFITNCWAALLFSSIWLLGGELQPWSDWWQPFLVASLYILGQVFTFAAVEHGDVSVATPVFGVKVIFVALILSAVVGESLGGAIWVAVFLAFCGILLVQWMPKRTKDSDSVTQVAESGRLTLTIVMAVCAAGSFATFDVVVQHFAKTWGTGRLIPIAFWMAGVLSLGFLPFIDSNPLRPSTRKGLLIGSFLVAGQAMFLVTSLGTFNDAARINVVYTLRGLWGVVLAWAVASLLGGREADLPKRIMMMRLCGASLLTLAVLIVILQ
ncbi:MAG: DMT family transporter [Pirellulaceae bacterium]